MFLQSEKLKKHFIAQPTFVVRQPTFVVQGLFRSYVVDNDGIGHTIQFAAEDWWISDINSCHYQKTTTMFIFTLEDSIILQIDFEVVNLRFIDSLKEKNIFLQPSILFYQLVFLQAGNRQYVVRSHCKQAFVPVKMFYFVKVDNILSVDTEEVLLFQHGLDIFQCL